MEGKGRSRSAGARRTVGWLGLVVLLASASGVEAQGRRPAVNFEVGQAFPLIPMPDAETGEPRTLAEFRGRKVLLHIFASW